MFSILTGTVLLGLIHAMIPHHWLPLVIVARTERWEKQDIAIVGTFSACAHVIGIVVLGIILNLAGARLAHCYEEYMHIVGPILLVGLSTIYFTVNLRNQRRKFSSYNLINKPKRYWIPLFAIMMFLSPCLEVESLFIVAGAYGLDNIVIMIMTYSIVSIAAIVIVLMLAFLGIQLFKPAFIETYQRRTTGVVLIAIGIITYIIH